MSRNLTVGASEIASVLGADPYRTPQDVWEAKVHGKPFETNEHIVRGQCLESGLLDWYEAVSGNALARHPGEKRHSKDARQLGLTHPTAPCSATLDGITTDGKLVVEAKCPASSKAWNERTGEHPLQYRLQVVFQIGIAQLNGYPVEAGELIAGPLWGKLQRHPIAPDPELFALAVAKATEFMSYVSSGTPLPASWGATNEVTL